MSGLLDLLFAIDCPEQVQSMAKQIGATPDQTEQAIGLLYQRCSGRLPIMQMMSRTPHQFA